MPRHPSTRSAANATAAAAVLTLAGPALACAQDDAPGRPLLTTADSVRVTLGGYLQADARAASGPVAGSTGVLLRRARLTLDVAARGGWSLRLQPDFGQGRAQIQDGFVAWTGRGVAVRAGRFRPAYGVERSLSSSTLLFPERGVTNAFMPSRLFGAQVGASGARASASVGAFQAAGVRDALVDTDGDPVGVAQAGADAVARAAWRPFASARGAARDSAALPRLELQAGVMVGHDRARDAEFSGVERLLTPALRPALAWADGTRADGTRRRASVGAQAAAGPLHVLAEGAWLAQRVRGDGRGPADEPVTVRARLAHAAWQARAGWVVGGTRTRDLDVRPRRRHGAVELGLRAGGARFDPAAAAFAEPGSSARALASGGAAAAWVPRQGTRVAASVDLTRLTGPTRGTERAAVVRVQQAF